MRQNVIVAKPPVYDRCIAVFGEAVIVGKPILWAWGDTIYNPLDIDIPRELFAHEAVHGERQLAVDPHRWWDNYLTDTLFRYNEERLAHRAEWRNMVKYGAGKNLTPAFEAIAGRLAGPLYGNVATLKEAQTDLLA